MTSRASFGVCESGSTETPADLQLRVGNPLRIGLNKAFCRSFATIIMYLVVSSILNSKKVGAKLLVRGALPISVLFWWAGLFIVLKPLQRKADLAIFKGLCSYSRVIV